MKCKKGYSDGPHGQIHWRMWMGEGEASRPDLYCLHPAPYSGVAYQNLAPLLANGRRVIAPDYPGYGGSDALSGSASIEDYSASVMSLVDTFSADHSVDLVGFHTGCLVAAEMCRVHPSRIRKSCLIDVPAFPKAESPVLAVKTGGKFNIGEDLDSLESVWKMSLVSRLKTQNEDQAWSMFAEHVRPGARMNAAFQAAFTYPWWDNLREISSEIFIIASKSALLDGSRRAAECIPGAKLIERLDIERSVLDEAAEKTATSVTSCLKSVA